MWNMNSKVADFNRLEICSNRMPIQRISRDGLKITKLYENQPKIDSIRRLKKAIQ